MPKTVVIRLFAGAREAAGTGRIDWPAAARGVSLRSVLRGLGRQHPDLALILRHSRFARNGTYLRGANGLLRPGDELSVHPPYSGG